MKTQMQNLKRPLPPWLIGKHHQISQSKSWSFAFSLDWNFEEVQQRLQKLFPALFLWFNHDVESSFASKHQFSLFCQPWVICFKERMRLQVVNHITHPTGKDLDRNS